MIYGPSRKNGSGKVIIRSFTSFWMVMGFVGSARQNVMCDYKEIINEKFGVLDFRNCFVCTIYYIVHVFLFFLQLL